MTGLLKGVALWIEASGTGQTASNLSYWGIVEHQGWVCLVTELADGGNVHEYHQQARRGGDSARRYGPAARLRLM